MTAPTVPFVCVHNAGRSDLSGTVDAIGDRVSPNRIIERRTNRMRDGIRSVRESVMGPVSSAPGAVTGKVGAASPRLPGPPAARPRPPGAPPTASPKRRRR